MRFGRSTPSLVGAGDEHVPGVLGDQVGARHVQPAARVGVVVLPVDPAGRRQHLHRVVPVPGEPGLLATGDPHQVVPRGVVAAVRVGVGAGRTDGGEVGVVQPPVVLAVDTVGDEDEAVPDSGDVGVPVARVPRPGGDRRLVDRLPPFAHVEPPRGSTSMLNSSGSSLSSSWNVSGRRLTPPVKSNWLSGFRRFGMSRHRDSTRGELEGH